MTVDLLFLAGLLGYSGVLIFVSVWIGYAVGYYEGWKKAQVSKYKYIAIVASIITEMLK